MCKELNKYVARHKVTAASAKVVLGGYFYWLDDKEFTAACNGTLGPKYLYRMVPPFHHLKIHVEDPDYAGCLIDGKFVPPAISPSDPVGHFLAAFPNMATLTVAWTHLVSLMTAGARDPAQGMRLIMCLNKYFCWLTEASEKYTWESVCRYHIRFTRQIFHKGATADKFDHIYDRNNIIALIPK